MGPVPAFLGQVEVCVGGWTPHELGMYKGFRKSHSCPVPLPHPRNVLELIEFFEEEDRFYLVFEKMRGGMWGPGDTSS